MAPQPDFEVTIVGAGPHGLAAALHLLADDPALRGRLRIVDPDGEWLGAWSRAFRRLDIGLLRSPSVHHPGPDAGGLPAFMRAHQYPRSGLAYDQPFSAVFDAYCRHLIDESGLGSGVLAARMLEVVPAGRHLDVTTSAGRFSTRALVVASNGHRRVLPAWLPALVPLPTWRLGHADDVDLTEIGPGLAGETIAVVGGGLTAAHLAVGAAERGARVHLLARRPVRVRDFDVEPGWLGPRNLDRYRAEPDPRRRLALARAARGGGSVPPWMVARLDELAAGERLRVHDGGPLGAVERCGDAVRILTADGQSIRPDRIWLATGTEAALSACRYLQGLVPDAPVVGDLPVLDADLRLGPWPVFITGRLATSALGPAAGNLWGARRAAVAIAGQVRAMRRGGRARYDGAGTG